MPTPSSTKVTTVWAVNLFSPPKLTAADLRLYQGNKQLAISFLQPQPVTVGILVDNYGMDSASTSSLEQAIDEAQRINVPIYSIGIGETADLTHLTDVTVLLFL